MIRDVLAEARAAVELEAGLPGPHVRAAEALRMTHLLAAQLAGRTSTPVVPTCTSPRRQVPREPSASAIPQYVGVVFGPAKCHHVLAGNRRVIAPAMLKGWLNADPVMPMAPRPCPRLCASRREQGPRGDPASRYRRSDRPHQERPD